MKLETKHIQSYPMGGDNPLMFLIPKHRFKYGEQISLPMNGMSINDEGVLGVEFLLPNGALCFSSEMNWCKPILRPLSDLTKEIKTGGLFLPSYARNISYFEVTPFALPHLEFEWIVKNHYDVFGLIKEELAIDINTL